MTDNEIDVDSLERRELRLKRDWDRAIVRLVKPVRTAHEEAPVGSLAEVTHYYRGLTLWTTPCDRCNVRVYARRVPECHVEYLGHRKPVSSRWRKSAT